MSKLDVIRETMAQLREEPLYRRLRADSEGLVDFSSNDYLGLSRDPRVIEAGCQAAREYGAGSTGSRLLSGNKRLFEEFEQEIARDKHTEAALVFATGFQANSGVLECLTDVNTAVIFDKLNHASMYQGVFASGARLIRFNHLDYEHLADTLEGLNTRNIVVASETVFGMDGDMANIPVLLDLSARYGALLYLDEAHATGLYGKDGYGLAGADLPEHVVVMGTFSKALGCSGAYVASTREICDFIIQRCRGFVYSTAPAPFCMGAARCAWGLVPSLSGERKSIMELSADLHCKLNAAKFYCWGGDTNIVVVNSLNRAEAQERRERCLAAGIVVSGVGPPTTPSPRIRLAVRAGHKAADVRRLVRVLKG